MGGGRDAPTLPQSAHPWVHYGLIDRYYHFNTLIILPNLHSLVKSTEKEMESAIEHYLHNRQPRPLYRAAHLH